MKSILRQLDSSPSQGHGSSDKHMCALPDSSLVLVCDRRQIMLFFDHRFLM